MAKRYQLATGTATTVHTGKGVLERIVVLETVTGVVNVWDGAVGGDEAAANLIFTKTNLAIGDIIELGTDLTKGLRVDLPATPGRVNFIVSRGR